MLARWALQDSHTPSVRCDMKQLLHTLLVTTSVIHCTFLLEAHEFNCGLRRPSYESPTEIINGVKLEFKCLTLTTQNPVFFTTAKFTNTPLGKNMYGKC